MLSLLAHPAVSTPVIAGWDLKTAIDSFKKYGEGIAGSVIGLIGIAILIVAMYHIFKKFTSSQPGGGESWGKVVAMLIVGGAMFSTGGWLLFKAIAEGGQKTISDAGAGKALIDLVHMSGLLG